MRASKGLLQAYDVQNFAHASIMSFKREVTGEDGKINLGEYGALKLLQLTKAWVEAQERVRICRNKPLPGVMKPEPKRKATQPAPITVLEPISAPEDPAEAKSEA